VASLIGAETDALELLTAREREVLSLTAEGLSNNADCPSPRARRSTIEGHVRSVLMKPDLPESNDSHRRVPAVISYLRAAEGHH
jgi:DNA-binding NarL/FixJ family response regulator